MKDKRGEEHKVPPSDPRWTRIADAVGARYCVPLGAHFFTPIRLRKANALYDAGFDVGKPLPRTPRFSRNGGPLLPMSIALMVAEAYQDGRTAA